VLDRLAPVNHTVPMDPKDELIEELRERIHTLEKELGKGWLASKALGLTPIEQTIVGVLVKRGFAPVETLVQAVYGHKADTDWPDGPEVLIKVAISKARRKVARRGAWIYSVWGRGYEMTDKDRETLSRRGEFLTPEETERLTRERTGQRLSAKSSRPRKDRRGRWT
jgi:hypothetical protein